jgi:transcriptional regulator with XRE-family HTH domain
MQIAQNIKKLREEKGLLQKEIAITIGIHPSNYSKMEKGEREFNIEVLDKLAKLNQDKLNYKLYFYGTLNAENSSHKVEEIKLDYNYETKTIFRCFKRK